MLWVTQHAGVMPIVKMSSRAHMDGLYSALKSKLSTEEIQLINERSSATVEYLPVDKVVLRGDKWRDPYYTQAEAIENKLDLIPSPLSMAERIKRGATEMPIRVVARSDGRYCIDGYDPFDQIKKYWAWIFANPGQDVPAYVLGSR